MSMSHGQARVDKRFGFIRGLYAHAQRAGRATYRKDEWTSTCAWIAKLALCEAPITSRHAAIEAIRGMGGKAESRLSEVEASKPSWNALALKVVARSVPFSMFAAHFEHFARPVGAGPIFACGGPPSPPPPARAIWSRWLMFYVLPRF